nr:PREDICTED: gelsolin-like [Lepisosteus oculatus]
MVSHKEFESAGKQPGLQIWRIENMDLKPVPKPLHGSFFTGDSYIVLQTTAAPSYNIHMWLGNECSQDESGAAAIFATQLDDHLGGGPVQFREVQGNESLTFLGYFKSGIKYKASQVAIDIRNNERNGRAKITMVEEDAEPQEIIAILGAKPGIPPGGPDDEAVETANKNKGSLYMVSDATGSMKTSLVAQSSPFKQAMLSPDECYILDNGVDNKLFLWKGSNANTGERKAAMKTAEQFIKDKNYSSKTQVQREPQPPFSPQVKACASSLNTNDVFVLKAPDATYVWRGVGATEEEVAAAKHVVAMLKGSASEVSEGKEPAGFWAALGGKKEYQTSRSLQKAVTPPRLFGCSNKTGRLVAEEVPGDFTQADLATDDVMLLDTGDQIFLWIGNEANDVEKTGAPKIAKEYVDSDPSGRRGIPVTTVKQGHEPPTFTGWFMAWDSNMWDTDPLDRIRANF